MPTFPPFSGKVLKIEAFGKDVRTWQERMRECGWAIRADGVFGPNMDRVVRLFQRECGLDIDGEIGPNTWDAAWTHT